ncbi:thiaminase II [Winogradskyella bathintestinalis]|uniref:Aminopyrimidine aminohydrolase n=1 Tax=Winogradskyella bathintestinalis TaxID=3035208 RepID=A0ABT7ZYI3_9FLAO|nr:thiaminase II [Winogradskyella bathintestinalis]MDN3494065.1 thiaminase II [Winogradskyella bathintestinalis]
MSNWYKAINQNTARILEQIKAHDFIKELMAGTLSKEIFNFYINQDAIYLSEYKKILAQIGVKCSDENDTQFFLNAATGIITVENALHQNFLNEKCIINEASVTCELYISYLSRMTHTKSLEEGLAAVLPCFTIYQQIGDYILANQTNKDNNPYQDWINTYGGEAFANSVKNAIEITNKYAIKSSPERIDKMNTAFEKASKLEWMFWDSAYNKESWKI